MPGRARTWSDDQFVAAVAKHANFTDVPRELGIRAAGGDHRAMKRQAARLALDTIQFSNERRVRGFRVWHERCRRATADVFADGSVVNTSVLRRYARLHPTPMCAAVCGNAGTWRRKPLPLQLDHRNGKYDDYRVEELRWLCPNSHSQTETFAGIGSGRARRVGEAAPRYRATPSLRPARPPRGVRFPATI